MQRIKKIVAVLCLVATILFCFSLAVSAASTKIHSGNEHGGNYGTTVKWKATSTGKKTITTSCTKGMLYTGDKTHARVYGSYQVKVFDSANMKKPVADKDIYDSKNGSVTFNAVKGKTYVIKVWFWTASSTAKSYIKKDHMSLSIFENKNKFDYNCGDAWWSAAYGYPTMTIKY
ncbi:MAG: hypothetical protein IJK98_09045 [Clostridia bacterium]|nr:hypothetical protein [Clostridia bacterium]